MKTGLIVIPVDAPGGAEKIAAMLAGTLVSRQDWSIHFVFLASDAYSFYAPYFPQRVQVTYGRGRGRIGSEWQLLKLLSMEDFDFVFSTHMRINLFLSVARRVGLLRCKRLVTRESTVLSDRYSGLRLLAYRIGYRLYGGQDMIVAQTQYMAKELSRLLPAEASGKTRAVDNPIDLEDIRRKVRQAPPEFNCDEPALIWCGRMIDVKRPSVALEVLAKLRDQGETMNLVFVGRGPLEQELRQQTKKLALEEFVYWAGHIENPYPVFARGTYGIITSLSEGFPNTLLEMLACGVKAVVVTPCAGNVRGIPGVSVASGFSSDQLVSELVKCIDADEDNKSSVGEFLSMRSPMKYAEELLGDLLTA